METRRFMNASPASPPTVEMDENPHRGWKLLLVGPATAGSEFRVKMDENPHRGWKLRTKHGHSVRQARVKMDENPHRGWKQNLPGTIRSLEWTRQNG